MMEQLRLQATDWGVELDDSQLSLLGTYGHLLANYEMANVIGTRDWAQIVREHLVDALSCFVVADLHYRDSLVDVGSGGGLPGIPLAIVRPELRVTLLETTEKKARFLEYARVNLNLPNLQVLNERAEHAGRNPDYRGVFDLAAARALAALPVVVEYCAPLVHPEGAILAMKGRLSKEEVAAGGTAAHELGAELREIQELEYCQSLPSKQRQLVIFDKVRMTPDRFPRKAGLAKKRPLGGQKGKSVGESC